jgi:transposase
MRRYELTDGQFALVEDLLPANCRRGGQWNDHRTTLNGILWVLHTGAQWRELSERYGNWKSVHDRLTRWGKDGTLDRILARLHLRLNERGLIDEDLWCVDATSIRASRSAAGGKKSWPASRPTTVATTTPARAGCARNADQPPQPQAASPRQSATDAAVRSVMPHFGKGFMISDPRSRAGSCLLERLPESRSLRKQRAEGSGA